MRFAMGLGLLLLAALPARAEVLLDGFFTADAACPAYQSINKQTNPGNVSTRPGTDYVIVAANKEPASYFQIVVPGANPDRRWVAVDCGQTDAQLEAPEPAATQQNYRGTQYSLAVNWQPAFCETSPGKRECRSQTEESFEATNFTLHGLWPQPRDRQYCNVPDTQRWDSEDGAWQDLPELRLSPSLRRELDEVMPGAISALDRYEWIKHGTCYGTSQEEYYADALDMMLALNTSAVAELFAGNIGKRITLREVRAAFDSSFGDGAGERVSMDCEADGNRQIITELSIGLTGTINGANDFAALIAAASPAEGGCTSGMVDPVGIR